jgi:hypothetical protein
MLGDCGSTSASACAVFDQVIKFFIRILNANSYFDEALNLEESQV